MATISINPYQATGVYADEINDLIAGVVRDGCESVEILIGDGPYIASPTIALLPAGKAIIGVHVLAEDSKGTKCPMVYQDEVEIGDLHPALDRLTAYLEMIA
jgi:hypothetical protein